MCTSRQGFTLSELLIALVILGVIATFTIPKVLSSQGDSKRYAVLKETISAISELNYNGMVRQEFDDTTIANFFLSRLNAVKICNSNSQTQGCWNTGTMGDVFGQSDEPGLIMHNGAYVSGFENDGVTGANQEHIIVDWNGLSAPNTEGQDQIVLRLVYGNNGGDKPGTVIAAPAQPTSVTFYQEIFRN